MKTNYNFKGIRLLAICVLIVILVFLGASQYYWNRAFAGKPINDIPKLNKLVGIQFPYSATLVEAMDSTTFQGADTVAVVSIPRSDLARFLSQPNLSVYKGTEQAADATVLRTKDVVIPEDYSDILSRKYMIDVPAKSHLFMRHWDVVGVHHYIMAGWGYYHHPASSDNRGVILVCLDSQHTATIYLYYFY